MPWSILSACGCGSKVSMPLGPTEWALEETAPRTEPRTIRRNWPLPCNLHYWIRGGSIVWSGNWTSNQITSVANPPLHPLPPCSLENQTRENSGLQKAKVLAQCHQNMQRLAFLNIMEFDDASTPDPFDHVSPLQ